MPPRNLVWTRGAIDDLAGLLKRRKNKADVRRCVEQHLLAAANDLETAAKKWDGPVEDVWIYRFRCEDVKDGKVVALNLQAELEATNDTVGVLACGTIPL
jgi:hypothetical protein